MLRLLRYCVVGMLFCPLLFTQAQEIIYETDFSSGQGIFTGTGSVTTGDYGIRMRSTLLGPASITSSEISVSGFSNLQISFDRSTFRLDNNEFGSAYYSADGGNFQFLESTNSESGNVQFALGNAETIRLRFALEASNFFRRFDVTNIEVTGNSGSSNPNECDDLINGDAPMLSNGFGFDLQNTRNQNSSISAANVAGLSISYAHTAEGVITKRGAPAVTGQTVYYYSGRQLKAANLETGCEYWSYTSNADFRSSSIVLVPELNSVFVGDDNGVVHAVNALNGDSIWTKFAGTNTEAHMLTGGMQYHNGMLFVPVASREVTLRINRRCCVTHGMLRAYSALNGDDIWTYHTTPEPDNYFFYEGPSGASVWSTPTLDINNDTIYFGTGQNFSQPPTDTSDSIIALDMNTGSQKWIFQARTDDIWTAYTLAALTGSDFDFGASPILIDNGNTVIAGDKGGFVYSLDTSDGSINWMRRIGSGGNLGGVHWNMAVDSERVYVAIADVSSDKVEDDVTVDDEARPGVYALDLDTGDIVWEKHPTHFYQDEEYPSLYSASVTVTNDIVFAASLNGVVKAFSTTSGDELWSFDTAINVTGIDGTPGNGGTIDSVGVVVAGDYVLINSGYNVFGTDNEFQAGGGNALFVFSIP